MAGTDMAAARTASLDKMVFLLAVLVEKSRGDDNIIHLSRADMNSLTTGKTLLFLYNITRDNINIRQTCNLIFSLPHQAQPQPLATGITHFIVC